MKLLYSFLIVLFPITSVAQDLSFISTLENTIKESSGVIYLNNTFITHNDSGGEAALYEMDTSSGTIGRKVIIANAINRDWEDICADDNYIYIGDFGNNQGDRQDLTIYKILITDYWNASNDTVYVSDSTRYSYADQTDFTSSNFSTNYDAESIIAYKDSLYVFTKNWGDSKTNIYALAKVPGNYQVNKIDSIDSQGYVTGATYNEESNSIALVGYTVNSAFVIEISDFNDNLFSTGTINRHVVQTNGSNQLESIVATSINEYLITSEELNGSEASLYKYKSEYIPTASVIGIDSKIIQESVLYPNPTSGDLTIDAEGFLSMSIFDINGELIKKSKVSTINVSDLALGTYFVSIKKTGQQEPEIKKILIQ